eukprot:15348424-Ditylum_brightwellii.AAC.1
MTEYNGTIPHFLGREIETLSEKLRVEGNKVEHHGDAEINNLSGDCMADDHEYYLLGADYGGGGGGGRGLTMVLKLLIVLKFNGI